MNNKFIKESFELEGDFLNDCYLELSDLGFEFKISSNSISGELNGKYKFDEVIDLYRDFILRIEFEFQLGHEIVALINVCFGIASSCDTMQMTTIINCKHQKAKEYVKVSRQELPNLQRALLW